MTHDDTAAVGALLAQLAEREPLPPPPSYQALVRGGRRRLVRRRAVLAGAAALSVAAVVAGTVVALPGGGKDTGRPAAVAPLPRRTATTPATDPMTPQRKVVIGKGTDNQGHTWEVWGRLWPAPRTADESLRQLRAIAADEHFPAGWLPIEARDVPSDWNQNHLQLSGSVDGTRYPNPSYEPAGLPGQHTTTNPYSMGSQESGVFIGPESRGQEIRMLVGTAADDVGRVTVRWSDGTSHDVPLVRVGDSTYRWFAIRAQHGLTGVVTVYGAGGKVMVKDARSFRAGMHF
ncbi:hypothetical protein AB0M29_29505 [Streptomyces sp. NPDC051976]|uniref:hypothetical protein n=1 Tax=Streptomyces sp. NPDC051976 TaxID=3154947 RepID=UPI003431E1C8